VLRALPWQTDLPTAQARARQLLKAEVDPTVTVTRWIGNLATDELDTLLDRSTERSSHVKWCLGGRRGSYLVWLHQYKAPERFAAATRFAAAIHDHRYGFSSRVLSGALRVSLFAAEIDGDRAHLTRLSEQLLTPGMVTSLLTTEIHRIDSVADNTCTLLVQGPAVRHHSTVYGMDGQMERVPDLEETLPGLIAGLPDWAHPGGEVRH
jgi:hypothetical protein